MIGVRWPTCARCAVEIEFGFSFCAGCADEERVRRARRIARETEEGEQMAKLLTVVVAVVMTLALGCSGGVAYERAEPAAEDAGPERTEHAAPPPPAVCEADADCADADPCVARSSCLPDAGDADGRGCSRTYRVKGEACGGGADEIGNYGVCAYSTDEHVVGAPVSCAGES